MKTKIAALSIAATIVASSLGLAQFLVDTQEDNWNFNRNNTLIGEGIPSGFEIGGQTGNLTILQYSGTQTLNRVVIKILQPDTSVSPTISATISIASGTTTFSSDSAANRVEEETRFRAFDNSIYESIVSAGGNMEDYIKTKVSSSYANLTLESPGTISRSVNITQSAVTLFDSGDYVDIDGAELNAIFKGLGAMVFDFRTMGTFSYSRDTTQVLTAQLSGINSGKMVVEYYSAIPEPSVMQMLAGLGIVLVLFSNRRLVGLRRRH